MKIFEGKIAGILVAVIIHLIAGIALMLVQLGSLKINDYTKEYQVALEQVQEPPKKEVLNPEQGTSLTRIFQGDPEIMNIARNIANQPDVKINAADYIDKVKEELIASGKLGKDNYIDEQKKIKENALGGNLDLVKKGEDKKVAENKKDSHDMAANFSGPTRIYYNLPGRTHSYLPIPIYKCEGSGKAVLTIEVSSKGVVLSARIIPTESTTSDPCLIDAAVASALASRFNPDVNAQKNQTGTITYHFVAQ